MKLLNGSELAGYIKERQAKQVRSLRQAHGVFPKLAIVKSVQNPVIETYVRLKQRYGEEIGVEVEVHDVDPSELAEKISDLNADDSVHGIIIQLPIGDGADQDESLNAVDLSKDVDGLAEGSEFTAATAMSISWLLDGFNINLAGKEIVLIGRGRLVGAPLERDMISKGLSPTVLEKGDELDRVVQQADVVISATGVPGLVDANMLKQGVVAVDAGVATEDGETIGDFDESVYARDDLTVTPKKGGVGPLTVSALFENLLRAAS